MLQRVHLVLAHQAIRKRVEGALVEIECTFTNANPKEPFWDTVNRGADLLLVSHDLLPEPVAATIQSIVETPEHPGVVILADGEDADQRAELLAAGSFAVICTSISDDSLREALEALIARRQAELDNQVLLEVQEKNESRLSDFASTSPTMQTFMRTVRRVVNADSSLLILGQTGVGKERLARAIHEESPRGERPFVPVNCAAFPESLLESELFGYEKGAFTGAAGERRGCFEMAHGGTIFLDEIGEVPRHIQVKLLRVLQERQIQRLGSEDLIPIDVRIMAATNRDLNVEMDAQRFRRDLFYRLSVVTLTVPSLRDHPEDIPALLERYLDEFRTTLGKEVLCYSPVAIRALSEYSWPGNVRELINVVERASLLCESEEISLIDLPVEIGGSTNPSNTSSVPPEDQIQLPNDWEQLQWSKLRPQVIANLEREYLERHLRRANGRIGETASTTGLSTRTLYVMMQRHGLNKEDFKDDCRKRQYGARKTG